jgi:hypothetical protein
MNMPNDLRASERIPIKSRVQVVAKGRMVLIALATNISMGGVLLSAAPNLPVGSTCNLSILPSGKEDGSKVKVKGVVVRSDTNGTAVKFANVLDKNIYESFLNNRPISIGHSLVDSYLTYFRVCQDRNHEGCEELFGVNRRTFNRVFLSTFSACIPLAVLPVWAMKASLPNAPNWVMIAASFGYATVWLAVIQPTIDLSVFKILRTFKSNS